MKRIREILGFEDRGFYSQFFTLIVPLIIQQALSSALYMIDNLMVGQLGEAPIAAINAANQLSFLLQIITFGVTSGASILVAQFYGKGDFANVRKSTGLALTTAVITGGVFFCVGCFLPEGFMRIFSDKPDVISLGRDYIFICSFGFIFRSVSLTLASVLKSCERVQLPMYATVISVCINGFFNYMLIFGKFGAPALGIAGAAIATTIASVCETAIVISVCVKTKSIVLGRDMFRYSKALARRYFKTSAPVVINETLWSTGMTMYTVFFGRLGTSALAVAQIYNTFEKLGVIIMVALGNACSIIIGNKLGEGRPDIVKTYSTRILLLSCICGFISGAALLFAMPWFVDIFNVSDAIKLEAKRVIIVYCLMLFCMMTEHSMIIGLLRAGGDTVYSGVCDVLAMWGFGLPLLFFTGLVLRWPLWLAFLCAQLQSPLKFILFGKRIYGWKWLNNLTTEV